MKMGIFFRVRKLHDERGLDVMGSGKRFRHRLVQSLWVTGMLLAACPLMAVTNVKLSGTMPAFGEVRAFKVSPDGRYVVYLADQDTDQVFELYSVSSNGGSPIRLNPLLPHGKEVYGFLISPDSSRVVYRADQDTNDVLELYSVPIGGPAASGIKLNGVLTEGGAVSNYEISPDSSRVVYRADQDTNDVIELYSVPIGGPPASGIKLNSVLTAGRSVFSFQISRDSSRVVYPADQETDLVYELYSVPIGGPAAAGIKINKPNLSSLGSVNYGRFQISPDSSRVVYIIEWVRTGINELYSVPIGGPAASGIKLNEVLTAGGDVHSFQISPDNGRVVYQADQDTNDVLELYSVPIGGPAASGTKLNGILTEGGAVSNYEISPDSSRAVYMADQQTNDVVELYSVPIGGPAASGIKLNVALAGGYVITVEISPDSSRVVYIVDRQLDGVEELYSVPIGGPADSGIKLNGVLTAGGAVSSFEISPDSRWVVYHADQDTNDVSELYGVLIGGPAVSGIKLNGSLIEGGNVIIHYLISPDSRRVVYRADQQTNDVVELYMTTFVDPIFLPLILKN
jgi:Tol biopolymer transport system component